MVALGVAIGLVAGLLGSSVARHLEPYAPTAPPGSESADAEERIEAATGVDPNGGLIALVRARGPAEGRRTLAHVRRVARILVADPDVAAVVPAPGTRGPAAVSRDGRLLYLLTPYEPGVSLREQQDAARRLIPKLRRLGVELGGSGVIWAQGNDVTQEDFRRAELISFPFLFLLSLWFFRGLVAALVSAAFGGLAIASSLLILRGIGEVSFVSIFALNIIVALGVGLAFDYCLFVINRFREELARGRDRRAALDVTLQTSGRAISFSAVTVAVALSSMLVFPDEALSSMGLAGAAVTISSCLLALVVLPATLFLLGPRIDAWSPAWLRRAAERESRPLSAGVWYRLARLVTRRPVVSAVAASGALLLLAVPAFEMKLTQGTADLVPEELSGHRVDDAVEQRFAPAYATTPIRVVAAVPPERTRGLARRIERLDGVALVERPRALGRRAAAIDVVSRHDELAEESQDLVRAIRSVETPFPVAVGGDTAILVDGKDSLRDHLPGAIAVALLGTLIALFLLTGSVVLPVKAVLMNLLSISATFGAMVLVFQHGRFEELLGYESQAALILTIPPFIGALAFGLATDYGIFVLARIKENVDAGASDAEAIAVGLERTGRLVTAAALLFAVAVGATVTGHMLPAKEAGLGMVAAVMIDAMIVRTFLVPSLMVLLGRANWWAPRPLRRLAARAAPQEH